MANKSATAHASKSKKRGNVKAMHIKLAANGATSTMMHEPTEDSPYAGMQEGDETVHPSLAHLVKHVKAQLGPALGATTGDGGAPRVSPGTSGSATQPTSKPGAMDTSNTDEDEE
jgi:hypothetical protein